ncbi:unnamed protein product, partial [Staurois parvus]
PTVQPPVPSSATTSVPPTCAHQCHPAVSISTAQQCCQSVPPVSAQRLCQSVPSSCTSQCLTVPPINT